MTKFRDGLIGPTVILFAICFVMTLLLAFTYQTTAPIIEEINIQTANDTRAAVLPGASGFEQITGVALPEGVTDAYRADNGYVFTSGAKGFSGVVTYMIGITNEGDIAGINMFDHDETPGLGTKVAAAEYLAQYHGAASPDDIAAITGATRTSNSLKNSLKQAKAAFELVKGAA
jgi:electron transport complex protein RnfG